VQDNALYPATAYYRHKSLRSLQHYVHTSAEAIAAMTAAHDPAARRRLY